jgi:phytoene synthase
LTVSEAYDHCRAITHKHGGNFSVGFRFLPAVKRRAVYAAYAFCRVADDIADEGSDSVEQRLIALDAWQRELDGAYEPSSR